MTGMTGTFDASQFKPQQGFDKVMPGKYPFQIANTEIVPTKDGQGGMFVVSYQTPAGQIQSRYNLWNNNPKAVEIAHGQLSALCHATGVFRLDWQNEGAALRNAVGMIDVGWQDGHAPSPEKPEGGYTEVKRIYDKNGIEPGKQQAAPPQVAQQQPQPQAPMTQQGNGGWAPPNQQLAPAAVNTGWGAPQQQIPQNPQGNAQQAAPWSQGGTGQANPPWSGQK